jgi:Holliday junction resolvasome RuvABC endonuclease subunit
MVLEQIHYQGKQDVFQASKTVYNSAMTSFIHAQILQVVESLHLFLQELDPQEEAAEEVLLQEDSQKYYILV